METVRAFLVALIGVFLAFGAGMPASAKTVAILFDTSGSMDGRSYLPTFGMQVLAATVDGRAGQDKLLTLNFNDYSAQLPSVPDDTNRPIIVGRANQWIKDFKIVNAAQHRALMGDLGRNFRPTDSGTPYGPIEVMLDRLAEEAAPGEEMIFVLVSDGEYTDPAEFAGGRLVAHMRRVFEGYRKEIEAKGASLRVEYLFIDAIGGSANRDIVKEQGVRDTLLEVFNGPDRNAQGDLEGSSYVDSPELLWESLQDIIARVSATDRSAQRSYVDYRGNTVTIESPLSISRIVAVATGPASGSLPDLTGHDLDQSPTEERDISVQMNQGDHLLGNRRLRGSVRHMWFARAVSPGRYTLDFSDTVESGVMLLFETQAITALRVLDANGNEVPADAAGRHRLLINESYTFESQILDGDLNPVPVALDTLPDALVITLELPAGDVQSPVVMTLDTAANVGRFEWTPEATGTMVARTQASVPGFLSPKSAGLQLVVLNPSAAISVSEIAPTNACRGCRAGQIGVPVVPGAPDIKIGTFEVTAEAEIDGEIVIDPAGMPPGYEIRDQDGNVVKSGQRIPMAPGEMKIFEIHRSGSAGLKEVLDGVQDLEITVKPAGEWTGPSAGVEAGIVLEAPDMGLELIATTQSRPPGQADSLEVPGGELVRGRFVAKFVLTDLIEAPDQALAEDLVFVDYDGILAPLIGFQAVFSDPAATGTFGFDLMPDTGYWCLCWIGIGNIVTGSDARDVRVTYTGRGGVQSASENLPLFFPVGVTPLTLSCLLNAFYLLLILMFLRGIVAIIFTQRFPNGAVVEITDGRSVPTFKRLDRGNSVWWKAWFALFTGNPDEVRVVEGVRLRATSGGAVVDLPRAVPPWSIESKGETFEEVRERRPNMREVKLGWGERLENIARPTLSIRLKKRSSD